MKKLTERRRRFRPSLEELERRLAPLNLLDLGFGGLIFAELLPTDDSTTLADLHATRSINRTGLTDFTLQGPEEQGLSIQQVQRTVFASNVSGRKSADLRTNPASDRALLNAPNVTWTPPDADHINVLAISEILNSDLYQSHSDFSYLFEGNKPTSRGGGVSVPAADSIDLTRISQQLNGRYAPPAGDLANGRGSPQPDVPAAFPTVITRRYPLTGSQDTPTPIAPNPGIDEVNAVSLETEIIVPYQRQEPSAANQFDGEFIVELKPNASSVELAARHGFVHEFAYSQTGRNINLWRLEEPQSKRGTISRLNSSPEMHAKSLLHDREITDAYPVYHGKISASSFTNDPLLPAQWHLANNGHTGGTVGVDANVLNAWDLGVTGRGVTIGIVDEGVQSSHPDLSAHFDPAASYDFTGAGDDTPTPDEVGEICGGAAADAECHGTAVAGVAAAVGNNGIGLSGAAPNATIGSLRILANTGSATSAGVAEALAWNTSKADTGGGGYNGKLIDVSNNSWGFTAGGVAIASTPEAVAINNGAVFGRGGLGTVYVFAGGNDRTVAEGQSDVNYTTGIHNNRRVIAVAAVAHNGAVTSYSNPGAPLLISAPSSDSSLDGITTTDLDDSSGTANGYHRTDYTDDFNGTSSAAPLVSGVVALMLEANPNLTYRDVQHILVESAARDGLTTSGWSGNQSGRQFSHDFGFGLINAGGAVALASNWRPVGPELVVISGQQSVNASVADATTVTNSVSITPNIRVESVEVVFNATHAERDDLEVTLEHLGTTTTTSQLTKTRTSDTGNNYSNFVLTSRAHWGESSSGTWRLTVRDGHSNGVTGTFDNWTLKIYGTEIVSDTNGPRIARAEVNAKQLLEGKVSTFQVQFNEPITPANFTTADISLQRIGGSSVTISSVTAVSGTNDTVFDVAFAEQSTAGNYRVDIGPNITDAAANSLNQDGDLTNGEATQDKFSNFFTIGNRFVYSNSTSGTIVDNGSAGDPLTRSVSLAAVNVADVNVVLDIQHIFPSFTWEVSLTAPGATTGAGDDITRLIADNNTNNGSGATGNGYRDTVLDDDNPAAALISATDTTVLHYTDQYRPTNTLGEFDVNHAAGNWTLTVDDVITAEGGGTGTFNSFSVVVTPTSMFDISIDNVTNTDTDRDKIEVAYTVRSPAGGNGTAPSFNFVAFDSVDPFFNINSDTKIGSGLSVTSTNCVAATNCLTGGPHTIEMNANLFPDPTFTRSSELYSLLVADPEQNVLDADRFNNVGVLSGVTLTPDGTLYIAGNSFTANTITVTSSNVDFNGTILGHSASTTNDIVFTGGTEVDSFNASGVDEKILAFLGLGDDTYTGGNLTDAVLAGPGNDTLTGNNGNDRLYGMTGTDSVDGGAGVDTVSVGPGGTAFQSQTLSGGTGNDYLLIDGTSKNDRIIVWDPDSNPTQIGNSLKAIVASMQGSVVSGSDVNGPDNFGYVARKAAYDNIDLVPGGNVLTALNGADDSTAAVNLGANTFNFYGTSYTGASQLFVSTNGLVSLGSAISTGTNINLTSSFFTDTPLIAPYWDDLTTVGGSGSTDSTVLTKLDAANNLLIIEWSNVPHVSVAGSTATFQVILKLNTGSTPGDITFNYVDVDFGNASFNNGASATVGIQKATTTIPAVNQLLFDGSGAAAGNLLSGTAFVLSAGIGLNAKILQDTEIINVESGDVLLVNASYGNDRIELVNPGALNTGVGINAMLIGGPGNDSIFDGLGADTIAGDSGYVDGPNDGTDDMHSSADGKVDRLIGKNGTDTFDSAGSEDQDIFTTP